MTERFFDILSNMSRQKQLVFGLLAAERFIECYKIFNRKEKFGNIIYMLESLRLIEEVVLGEAEDADRIEKYINIVGENTPHMDDFGSVGGSLALNVSGVIYEALNLVGHFEERRLKDIATFCTDSIDALILEIEDFDQMEFEKVNSHHLMKEELQLQEGIVKYLEKIQNVDSGDIEALRLMQEKREFNNLDIRSIIYS